MNITHCTRPQNVQVHYMFVENIVHVQSHSPSGCVNGGYVLARNPLLLVPSGHAPLVNAHPSHPSSPSLLTLPHPHSFRSTRHLEVWDNCMNIIAHQYVSICFTRVCALGLALPWYTLTSTPSGWLIRRHVCACITNITNITRICPAVRARDVRWDRKNGLMDGGAFRHRCWHTTM